MKAEEDADELLRGILKEIEQLGIPGKTGIPEAHALKAADRPDTVPPLPKADQGDTGQNPAFVHDVRFMRLPADQKIALLTPVPFLSLPEMEKDSVIAVRDHRKKTGIFPGENLYSRTVGGEERYLANVRGRVLMIGNSFHILPSDLDGRLSAQVEPGKLTALLDIHPAFGDGRMPKLPTVLEYLAKHDIRSGIRESSIIEGLEHCARSGKSVMGLTVAKGTAPSAGKAGALEFFFDKDFQGPVLCDLDAAGAVDFRNVKWVPMVAKDHLLARVTPAVQGTDGLDVAGRVLPAKPIPKTYLVAGQNVRSEKEETEFYSDINGCAQLNGTLISVMNVFVVNSDVDYHTGNIRFQGNVLITGTVRKGFEVEADGDVVILENTEPCRIKAGRDIHVKGGVLGVGKGTFGLEAGRDITAGYAENGLLEAQGDISIGNYSLQTFLYSSGRITLDKRKGSLVGGEAMAAKGVMAKSLGSPTGIKTHVAAGVDFGLKRKHASLSKQEADLKAAAIKIDGFLRSLLDIFRRGALPPSKTQAMVEILEKRKQIDKARTATTVRLQEVAFQQENLESGSIKANEIVYPGVLITLRGRSIPINESLCRALFRLDEHMNQIVRGPA